MNDDKQWRHRAGKALRAYFDKRSAPRLILTAILGITGVTGFLASAGLLHLGLTHMWVRYPVAVVVGYAVFLSLIRAWVEFEKSRFTPEADEIQSVLRDPVKKYTPSWRSDHRAKSSWLDWLDVPDLSGLDDGCLPVLVVTAVIAVIALLVVTTATAPALAAEVFIDAFVVSVLYRHLRKAVQGNWLGTAVRKTWFRALAAALLLSLIGWCLEMMAPESHSIGPALQKILNG